MHQQELYIYAQGSALAYTKQLEEDKEKKKKKKRGNTQMNKRKRIRRGNKGKKRKDGGGITKGIDNMERYNNLFSCK